MTLVCMVLPEFYNIPDISICNNMKMTVKTNITLKG